MSIATIAPNGPTRATSLPEDGKARKQYPIASGLLDYFPDAMVEIAHLSWVGNEQHNPGEPLHWARDKSTDQDDTLMRHFLARGTIDSDGVRHSTKVAWRALALLQLELEQEQNTMMVPQQGPLPGWQGGLGGGYQYPSGHQFSLTYNQP